MCFFFSPPFFGTGADPEFQHCVSAWDVSCLPVCCFKGCLPRLQGSVTGPQAGLTPRGSLQERDGRKATGCEHQVGRLASNGHKHKKNERKKTCHVAFQKGPQMLLTWSGTCADVRSGFFGGCNAAGAVSRHLWGDLLRPQQISRWVTLWASVCCITVSFTAWCRYCVKWTQQLFNVTAGLVIELLSVTPPQGGNSKPCRCSLQMDDWQ